MCIAIIQKEKTGVLSKKVLQNCWDSNPDGCSFSYFNDEIPCVFKFLSFKNFYKSYYKERNLNPEKIMLLHFRIGTSGANSIENVHPFKLSNGILLAHNGILNIDIPKNSKLNDTRYFISQYLEKLPVNWINNPGILNLISYSIENSKFVLLYSEHGKTVYKILNESLGHWKEGIWYSNSSYIKGQLKYGYKIPSYFNIFNTKCIKCKKELETVVEFQNGECESCMFPNYKKRETIYCASCSSNLLFDEEIETGFCINCNKY